MGPLAKTLLWIAAVLLSLIVVGAVMFASTELRQAALAGVFVVLAMIFAGVGLKK